MILETVKPTNRYSQNSENLNEADIFEREGSCSNLITLFRPVEDERQRAQPSPSAKEVSAAREGHLGAAHQGRETQQLRGVRAVQNQEESCQQSQDNCQIQNEI